MAKYFLKNTAQFCLIILCWLVTVQCVHADEIYRFDKNHSSISFSVSHFGIFQTAGRFAAFDGNFIFCVLNPQKDSIAITLYSAGIETDDEKKNEELRGPDFFNATQFPTVKFVSTSVEKLDKNNARVTGNLTMLGVTRPAVFDAHFTEKDHDADTGETALSFTASGTINRSEFGMNHLIPLVGDEVSLKIQVKGIEKNSD